MHISLDTILKQALILQFWSCYSFIVQQENGLTPTNTS
jgi:hypothetical protein